MPNTRYSILDTDRIGPTLFKLVMPAFIGMFVLTLYNVVNTIFIGHYVGSLGIAGLSIVFPYQMFAMGIGQVSGIGGASIISRLIGARNSGRAEKALGNAITFNFIISVIIMIGGLAYTDFWLKLAGADEAVMPYAKEYMTIVFYGIIAHTFVISFNGLTISQGNTRVPMIAQITGAVLNIILDAILIIGFDWGVKGAAIGTIISQFVTVIIFMVYYLSNSSYLKLHLNNLIPDLAIIKEIMAIGISALLSTLASSIGGVLVMRMLMNYGGDLALSTFGILNRILMFSILPGLVIGQGLQPLAGFNYGAKRYDRVLKGIKLAFISSMSIGILAFFILYFIPGPIIKIFTTDTALIQSGVYAIHRAFFFIYLVGYANVGATIFQALGKAGKSFISTISRSILFMIPCLFILGHFWQLDGIWLCFPTVDLLTSILITLLLVPQINDLRRKRIKENTNLSLNLETAVEAEQRK